MAVGPDGRCTTCGQQITSTMGCTYCADPRAQLLLRWIRVAQLAGTKLEVWYLKHRGMIDRFLPAVPRIAAVLKRADIDEMERLLT